MADRYLFLMQVDKTTIADRGFALLLMFCNPHT